MENLSEGINFDNLLEKALYCIIDELHSHQIDMDIEIKKLLYENLWDLYE